MAKKPIGAITDTAELGIDEDLNKLQRENWSPLNGGVSIGQFSETKDSGIEIRGCSRATTKGKKARGPMA